LIYTTLRNYFEISVYQKPFSKSCLKLRKNQIRQKLIKKAKDVISDNSVRRNNYFT